ncbi:MAG: hypothetical protein II520_01065 [Bacilli bacterium]|nr:hypothetical protein [Bacilli bacterium]
MGSETTNAQWKASFLAASSFRSPLMVVMIICAGFYSVFHLVAHLKKKKAAKA